MRNKTLLRMISLVLVMLAACTVSLSVSAATICTPTSMVVMYDAEENELCISGTYTGKILPNTAYMISLVDANSRMITTQNRLGSVFDKGNGVFAYSFELKASALTGFTMPMKLTLSCVSDSKVIAPITAEVSEPVTLTFVTDGNGTLTGEAVIKIPKGTKVDAFGGLALPEAVPNKGYAFDSWNYTVTDDAFMADTTVTAVFKAFKLGDVNNDGGVDNLDATLILQHDAGLIDLPCDVKTADVNEDDSVDNLDAVMVLKFDAGLIEEL